MNEQRSTNIKRIYFVGFPFGIGTVLGILGVVVFQNFVPQNEYGTHFVAQGGVEATSTNGTSSISSVRTGDGGQFQEIFKHDSIAEQHNALHSTLSQATEHELKNWWLESKTIERNSQREIAQQVILRNLTAKNPREALRRIDETSKLHTERALEIVFGEWAVIHLEDAIEGAITLKSSQQTVALGAILETRDDLTEAERHTIAMQLSNEDTLLKIESDKKASQNIESPVESWKILLADNVDDVLQADSLTNVAEAWHKQIGFEVLSQIFSEIEDFPTKLQLLRSITQVDPAGALEYSRGLPSEENQSTLSTIIAREWARADPQSALATVSKFAQSNLTWRLEREITKVWARTNPHEMIENVEIISPEHRTIPLERAFMNIAREDPLSAFERLSSVEHLVGNTSTLVESIVREWADQAPETATEWVLENYARESLERQYLLAWTLRSLTRQSPEKAFELAIEQPVPSRGWSLDFYVMREMIWEDEIDLAKRLLPKVSELSKSTVYKDVALALVADGRTSEALELGQDLEESRQRTYYQSVFDSWAGTNPTNLMESLDALPTSTLKSIGAMQLLTRNHRDPVLHEDEIDRAKTFLSPEDKASVKQLEEL